MSLLKDKRVIRHKIKLEIQIKELQTGYLISFDTRDIEDRFISSANMVGMEIGVILQDLENTDENP